MNPQTHRSSHSGVAVAAVGRSFTRLSMVLFAMLVAGFVAQGATVLWRAPNVTVHLDLPFASLEFQNPLAGTENVLGHPILEWLDADYTAGPPRGYGDWIVNPTNSIDGNVNEIWLRATGHLAQAKFHVASDIVSIHLVGDDNDGVAAIYVDGVLAAKLDMFCQSPPSRTALVVVRDLPLIGHHVLVRDESPGQPDDVALLGAAALKSEFKWQQPPVLTEVDNLFNGWNEISVTNHPPIAADDWVCTSANPVTKIRWWGSFANWLSNTPPPFLPNAFQITIWTDKPADPADPESFSHPNVAIWQTHCTSFKPPQFVGYDYDPRTGEYEACFLFEQDLLPHEYFRQEPGPAGTNIFWISIAGEYWQGTAGPWPWGWKTRPRDPASPAPDDAVRIFAPPPWLITPGTEFVGGEPIYWPDRAHSWDLAFELVSETPNSGTKWVQPPDLTPEGMDVHCMGNPQPPQFLLADDFLCTNTGPVTKIVVYGSWYKDEVPPYVEFWLSFHNDIPATGQSYSMPGPLLWSRLFSPGQYTIEQVPVPGLLEGWLTPPAQYEFPGDTMCFKYTFQLNPGEFIQTGTPEKPMVYWLDVQARVTGSLAPVRFGWKTSPRHWNDDAVWAQGTELEHGPWMELRYPPPHPKAGQSIDLAFEIYSEGGMTVESKWSQPPVPYHEGTNHFRGWNEPSLHGREQIVADDWACADPRPISDIHWWGSFLGWAVPVPPEAAMSMPSAFTFTIWSDVPAQPGGLGWSHPGEALWQVTTTNYSLSFVGWDWDPRNPGAGPEACFKFHVDLRPDEWFYQEPGPRTNIYWVSIAAVYPGGTIIQHPWGWKTRPRDLASPAPDDAVRIFVPTAPVVGSAFQQGVPIEFPAGTSWDMAFELTAGPKPPGTDWGDAPRPYPTQATVNGAVHTIVPGLFIGARVDAEADGQPDPNALGDDNNPPAGPDDEDGVVLNLPFFAGQTATFMVHSSSSNLLLNAWFDFGADGSWAQAGDQILTNQPLVAGANAFSFQVPANAVPTNSFARFRVSTAANLSYTGAAPDGEVEDHEVRIERLDFGDAPDPGYPTLLVNNGARHIIGPMFLGARVDAELDGQPSANADADDLNPPAGPDDEDGVTFHTTLISRVPNTITVTTSIGGYLQAWLDANGDGDWADAGEQVITDRLLVPGPNQVNFLVPAMNLGVTRTMMRFRLSGVTGLGYNGLAPDGEVEDYSVKVESLKWLRRPELGWEGVDVDNSRMQLADDFLCIQSGPITDFHIWGSFASDILPVGGIGNMTFTLFLYSDVPAGPGRPYSRPGELLWQRTFRPGEYSAGHAFHQPEGEWWFDPVSQFWRPNADKNIYQFDFYVDREQAFRQVEGTIYWLGVKYIANAQDDFTFGWKTTYEPWNDDACWLDTSVQPAIWREMRYGDGHPWAQQEQNSLNLAFAVSGEPAEALDFGDAPDGQAAPGYPTLLANNGARHTVVPGLMLGKAVDIEADGQPNATATGDDNNPPVGMDDEDGIIFPVLVPGQANTVQVTVTGVGVLNAWLDFGADGKWSQAGDQIFTNVPLATGVHTLTFNVPSTAPWGATTFARFRFSTASNLSYTGAAPDGEVEDHLVNIHPLPNSDLGDAPDSRNHAGVNMTAYPKGGPPGQVANFPTVAGMGPPFGPLHFNTRAAFLGMASTGELEADQFADEDFVNNLAPAIDRSDLDAADDGLLPGVVLPHCKPGMLNVQLSWAAPIPVPQLFINVWCDWNRDGDWNDSILCPDGQFAPEWAAQNVLVPPLVPAMPVPILKAWHPSLHKQPIWMRITLSEMPVPGPLGWSGAGGDGPGGGYQFGETEDYYLTEYEYPQAFDLGDAPSPYPTLLANSGAQHLEVQGFQLGRSLDAEPDGLPHALALGDDLNNVADEDGVSLATPLLVSTSACVNVFLTGAGGKLDAWMDFNKNGTWEGTEQIFNGQALVPGNNTVCFSVPLQSTLGTNFARFRLSSLGGLSPTGVAPDGEVEDYQFLLKQHAPSTNIVVTWIGVTNLNATSQVVTVQWNAETNTHYEVLAASNLGTNNGTDIVWQVISPIIIGPSNRHTHTNTATSQRYYRVRAPWIWP